MNNKEQRLAAATLKLINDSELKVKGSDVAALLQIIKWLNEKSNPQQSAMEPMPEIKPIEVKEAPKKKGSGRPKKVTKKSLK